MRPLVPALLAVCLLTTASAAEQAPLYTNVEIVSVDAPNRSLMVRTNAGQARMLRVDEQVNLAGLRRGDEVIVALRGDRVSRILRRPAPPTDVAVAPPGRPATRPAVRGPGNLGSTSATAVSGSTSATSLPPDEAPADPRPALDAFATRVALISEQAFSVDAAWSVFANACNASAALPLDRAWFALWEQNGLRADLSTSTCRELYNKVVDRGEPVKAAMAAAEDRAREAALLPGALREIRRRYAMDWDGWELPAPARLGN